MVRAKSTASIQYQPGDPPKDAAEMQRFLREELTKIKAAFDLLAAGHIDVTYAAPAKPRDGDIRYADGVHFKPNGTGGVGIWYYNGGTSTWVQLG